MTIASEITRLQWAKASARTSIINKGVSVPANASVEDYHTYIDQIQTWGTLISWLVIWGYVSNKQYAPEIISSVSWVQDNKYYGCCVCSIYWWTSNSLWFYLHTYRKVDTTNDMSYTLNDVTGNKNNNTDAPQNVTFWTNGNSMKVIMFIKYPSTTPRYMYQTVWDFKTTGSTSSSYQTGSTTNISDYNVDLTWYTQITTNEWVRQLSWALYLNRASIYITLK